MKLAKLILLLNFIIIVGAFYPVNSTFSATETINQSSIDSTNQSSVLVVYENMFDYFLARNISDNFDSYNFTFIQSNSTGNINDFFLSEDLGNYSSVVLILSSDIQNMNSSVFEKFTNLYDSNTSFAIISAKIWQFAPEGRDFFGVAPISGIQNEFNPSINKSYNLVIQNTTFLQEHNNFSINQEIQSLSSLAIVEPVNNNSLKIISSSELALSQNKSETSGIFIKENVASQNYILSIPISIRNNNDQNSSILISTLVHNMISFSMKAQSANSALSTTTPNSDVTQNYVIDTNPLSISEVEITAGLLVVSTIALAGAVSYNVIPSNFSKKDEDLEIESDSDISSAKLPFIAPLLMFIFGILLFFKATIYSNKFNRLNVFQVKENPVRRTIIEILEVSGYEHFNGLQKKLKIGVSILIWHLEVLEDFNLVETKKFGQYRVVFLTDNPPDTNEVIFYCNIRSRIAISIIKLFLDKHYWSIESLSSILYSSNDLIKYHCTKLQKLNILTYNKSTKVFSLNTEYQVILANLIQNHPEFLT